MYKEALKIPIDSDGYN